MESLRAKNDNETILVIEDESSVRHLSEKVLGRFGYQVISASDGQLGIDMYMDKHEDIDLVLLDMTMPRLSGAEVLDLIHKHDTSARVVISSGRGADHYEDGLFDKTKAFIYKPYQINELLETVRNVLDS